MNSDEIIILLGAGASYDANIPISSEMIKRLELLINDKNNQEWGKYKELYYCLKSGIQYGFGIINKSYDMNIELLVNTMEELIKSYEHPIYPFVGSWIPRLDELIEKEYKNVKDFRILIIKELVKWMDTSRPDIFNYFYGFIKFQREFQYPINIFTLNYDECLEKQCKKHNIECNRGFKSFIWDYKNFERHDDACDQINYYKLHGSIDWENNDITIEEKDGIITNHAIIFGTSYKMQYIDPFLYLLFEFRRLTLESATKIINCIGYSFNDEHINGILRQALIKDASKKIISIQPIKTTEEIEKNRIKEKLNLENSNNIIVDNKQANLFLEEYISKEYFEKYINKDDLPF